MKSIWPARALQKGFTLIELMVVVAIIGIIAAIAIPQYSDYSSRSRAAGAVAEMSTFRTGFAVCMSEQGNALANCVTLGANGIPATPSAPTKNIVGAVTITAATGSINANTGATAASGAPLTFALTYVTPVAGAAVQRFTQNGTICNASRGLKSGTGDCP